MEIEVKIIKELEDGSAICSLDLDKECKEYLIGEGFLEVLKRSIASSESYIKAEVKDDLELQGN